MNRTSRVFLLIIVFLLLIIGVLLNLIFSRHSVGELVRYEYGDTFSSVLYTAQDEIYRLPSLKNTLILYVSDGCGTCLDTIGGFETFRTIFSQDDFDCYIVWEDNMPRSIIDKHSIPISKNLTLKGRARLSVTYPTVFLLDQKKDIIYQDSSMENVVKKIIQENIGSAELIRENATRLLRTYVPHKESRKLLIYFSMTGCADCLAADDILYGNEKINSKYYIERIYRPDEKDKSKNIDQFGIYRGIFGINWYPSFLIVDENLTSRFIGEIDLAKLENELLK